MKINTRSQSLPVTAPSPPGFVTERGGIMCVTRLLNLPRRALTHKHTHAHTHKGDTVLILAERSSLSELHQAPVSPSVPPSAGALLHDRLCIFFFPSSEIKPWRLLYACVKLLDSLFVGIKALKH